MGKTRHRPLCFVLMPSGRSFDALYDQVLAPAVRDAGMDPVRGDAGAARRALVERLLLCDFAVVDLTGAGADLFYELGARETARPYTTVAILAAGQEIPFDLGGRTLRYQPGKGGVLAPARQRRLRADLRARLGQRRTHARKEADADRPLFQLVGAPPPPDLAHLVTDTFRERARYSEPRRRALARARAQPREKAARALQAIEARLGPLDDVEGGVLIDLYLSYRAVEAWDAMIDLAQRLPRELRGSVMVSEQLGFALNRRQRPGDVDRALELLAAVEAERGPNPETSALIGRIHKDRWQQALRAEDPAAAAHLDAALAAYLRGYEADWRDCLPGINVVTLLELRDAPGDREQSARLLPVVRYAVDRRMAGRQADYWDLATQVELAVLAGDEARARAHLQQALAAVREVWEPKTTVNNLTLIAEARDQRGQGTPWLRELIARLLQARPADQR